MLRQTCEGWGQEEWGLGWTSCAQVRWCFACLSEPSLGAPWRRGSTQSCRRFFWAELPNHFRSFPQDCPDVPLPCHAFQLLHSEVTSKNLHVLYPPVPFSFPLVALYCRQPFWHVLFSLWQEDGSVGKPWINRGKSPKLEIGIALLSTVLLSWLPLQPEESKRVMSFDSSAPLLVWI